MNELTQHFVGLTFFIGVMWIHLAWRITCVERRLEREQLTAPGKEGK
jgi:hypothetical protein